MTTTLIASINTSTVALDLRRRLAHHVARFSQELGFTPAALAATAEVPASTVARILAGQDNTPLSTITALARALQVEPRDLLAPLR